MLSDSIATICIDPFPVGRQPCCEPWISVGIVGTQDLQPFQPLGATNDSPNACLGSQAPQSIAGTLYISYQKPGRPLQPLYIE